ncbi:MAG: AMP-binding protein, partial [Rhodospirillaceae bacterium]|nr:AMP-binding protein [Rhodospirillaceae bacterium]
LSAGLSAESVTLTAAPQFHTAGLNSFATPLLHLGGTLAVMDRWEAGAALRHLADPNLRVSHTLGVPTQFMAMARHPDFADARFPAVRIAAVGGAPPTLDLLDTWAAKGLALVPGYGMTEVFGVTQTRADIARRKPTAVGWPALYTSIRIAGDDGSSRPTGTVGEIQIRSPGVTPGYWRQPQATAQAFIDGWFRTGDLGFIDDEGLLHVVDRLKDMFISGGENVYPAEIENVMAGFPEVGQVAVIGLPDPVWGEVGRAIVVLKPGAAGDAAALIARCRGLIASYKVPKSVVFVPALPLNAQGKVLKTELRRLNGSQPNAA